MLSASPGQPCQPAGSRLMLNPLGPGPGVLWVPKKYQGSCCVIICSPQPEAAVWLAWLKPADPRKAVCSFLGAWGSQGIGRVSTEWRNPQMGDLFACPAEPHICLGAQFFPRPPFHPGRLQVASLAWPCPGALSCLPMSSPSLCQPVSCLACPPSAVFMSCSWVFLPCHVVPAGISAWVPNRCRELHVAPPMVESLGVGVQQGPSPRRHGERAGFGGAQRASQPQHSQPCDLGPVTGPLGPSFPSPRTLGTAGRRWRDCA